MRKGIPHVAVHYEGKTARISRKNQTVGTTDQGLVPEQTHEREKEGKSVRELSVQSGGAKFAIVNRDRTSASGAEFVIFKFRTASATAHGR